MSPQEEQSLVQLLGLLLLEEQLEQDIIKNSFVFIPIFIVPSTKKYCKQFAVPDLLINLILFIIVA